MRPRVLLAELDVGDLNRQRTACRHGISRVHGKVQDDLLYLPAIGLDGRQLGPQAQHHLHVFPDEASQHRPHVGQHDVQVEQRRLDDLLAAERQQLARECRGAHARLLNLGEIDPAPIVGIEIVQQQLAVAQDDGQQVVEVVGHAAGQLPDRFHLLRLLILRLQGTAFGDVGPGAERADDLPRVVALHRVAPFDQPFHPRPRDHRVLDYRQIGVEQIAQPRSDRVPKPRWQARLDPITSEQLFRCPSEERARVAIRERDPPFQVQGQEDDFGRVQVALRAIPLAAHGRFRLLALEVGFFPAGDIARYRRHAGDAARRPRHRRDRERDVDERPVLPHPLRFEGLPVSPRAALSRIALRSPVIPAGRSSARL